MSPTRALALGDFLLPGEIQGRRGLRQYCREIGQSIQRPQCTDPMPDLHRTGPLLHGAQGRNGDTDALREQLHGFIAAKSCLPQSHSERNQYFLGQFNENHNFIYSQLNMIKQSLIYINWLHRSGSMLFI